MHVVPVKVPVDLGCHPSARHHSTSHTITDQWPCLQAGTLRYAPLNECVGLFTIQHVLVWPRGIAEPGCHMMTTHFFLSAAFFCFGAAVCTTIVDCLSAGLHL